MVLSCEAIDAMVVDVSVTEIVRSSFALSAEASFASVIEPSAIFGVVTAPSAIFGVVTAPS